MRLNSRSHLLTATPTQPEVKKPAPAAAKKPEVKKPVAKVDPKKAAPAAAKKVRLWDLPCSPGGASLEVCQTSADAPPPGREGEEVSAVL